MKPDDAPPGQNTTKPNPAADPAKDEKYAQSLAKMAALDYSLQQSKAPAQKHFISKKVLIYLGISAVASILSLIVMALTSKDSAPSPDLQTQQLLDSAKELQELRQE